MEFPQKDGWIKNYLICGSLGTFCVMRLEKDYALLLLLDGHLSHYCPDNIKRAIEENVIVFTLPPNTTHVIQPLDKGVFGPLKSAWREVCHSFLVSNPGRKITKYDFSHLFSEAWMKALHDS